MRTELNPISKRLDVQDFVVLLAVSETGSFRKAAMRLGIGQSAATRRIQRTGGAPDHKIANVLTREIHEEAVRVA